MAKKKSATRAVKGGTPRRPVARTTTRRRSTTRAERRDGSSPASPPPAIRVRMYRQGLGDCFLVTFDVGGDEKHMLIDCGTLGATTTGVRVAKVVANVRETTGDHLHVLVATHEHKDHVAGFGTQRAAFEAMTIDNVWLAWTENPKDDLAQQIVKKRQDLGAALARACQALTALAASAESRALGLAVRDVLDFSGDPDSPAGFSESINEAMAFVRTGLVRTPRYCDPREGPIEEDWLPGFRIYVLGPPRRESALDDAGEHGSDELYGMAPGLGAGAAFQASGKSAVDYLGASDLEARDAFVAAQPFDARFRVEPDSAAAQAAFARYVSEDEAWRRVDDDWLHIASDLALQLDKSTNNTSLALAIERTADGRVLLFPADAQQGNWLSWHEQGMAWSVRDGGVARTVRARDLLSRAVFYKVGHHASHNATARGQGLELMEREDELTAFIPVDRAVALGRHPQGSWRMPAVKLYRRLLERCQGRVVRSDIGWADDAANAANAQVESELLNLASADEWARWRRAQRASSRVAITDLFVDYLLD
jgi:hypothetical protein